MSQTFNIQLAHTTDTLVVDINENAVGQSIISIGLENEDGRYTDILVLDQFDGEKVDMLADSLSLYVWSDQNDDDYTHKFKFELEMMVMRDSIKQLINGYEFTTTQQPVVKQTIETIRNLTNALFTIGKVDAPFQDTDADYIENI